MSCEDYHEKFQSLSEAYISCSGSFGNEDGLVEKEMIAIGSTLASATVNEFKDSREVVRHAYLGCLFIYNLDQTQY